MDLLTTSQVATLLGVSDQTIRRMIADGSIPGFRLSDDSWYRIDRSQLAEYANRKNIRLDWSLIEKQ